MKNFILTIALVAVFLVLSSCATNENTPTIKAPSLYVYFGEEQRVQAIQLTTDWSYYDEHGNLIGSILFDSPHPLQKNEQDFDESTLQLVHRQDWMLDWQFIGLDFTYEPVDITVTRWRLEHLNATNIPEGAPIELIAPTLQDYRIPIFDVGYDYIYMVIARWQNGSSIYAFRANGGGHPEIGDS